jgi:TRAP-type C4-dicarboxylate transport system permease small subunit
MEIIACITLAVILGMVVVEITARSIFGISHTYLVELPPLLLGYITFLYAATGLRVDRHIKVSLIRENLDTALGKAISLIVHSMMTYAGYLMLRTAISLIKLHITTKAATYTAVPIPMWIFSISCPVGLGLAFALCIDMTIRDIVRIMNSIQNKTEN